MRRRVEGLLLLAVGLYVVVGLAVLHGAGFLKGLRVPLVVGGATVTALLAVHWYWSRSDFRGDRTLFPAVALLAATGLVFLLRLDLEYGLRQFVWLLTGLAVLAVTTGLLRDYRLLAEYQYFWAAAGAAALLAPLIFGQESGGARSWLKLGAVQFQPSEFAKVFLVVFLAVFLARATGKHEAGVRLWLPPAGLLVLTLVVLGLQNDIGTAAIYFATFLTLVYAATARVVFVAGGLVLLAAGTAALARVAPHVRVRLETWLNPWPQVQTHGYQITQSLFAIAAGGITGTGLGAGHPEFVPAAHTDFIFAAVVEELGFLGGAGCILLFVFLVYRGLKIALECRDRFGTLLATGCTALLGWQGFVIMAGVTRLLPLTGVTLPFVSYGGSSLVTSFILLGLLLNISHAGGGSTHEGERREVGPHSAGRVSRSHRASRLPPGGTGARPDSAPLQPALDRLRAGGVARYHNGPAG